MNREIKFRVWCPTSKHFSTQPWLSCDGLMLKWEHTVDIQTLTDIRFDNYVIQLYTGLKDKNGKEIYEGDVLKIQGYRGAVHHVQVKWESVDASDDMGMDMIGFPRYSQYGEPEVIGNIFENPELLEA